MKDEHIIIIGAGAAGLMAAKELSNAGKKVTMLEARDYPGGRIHTIYNELFATHAELGAEWVHGDLPVSLALLKEANIPYHKTGGQMFQSKDGKLKQEYHQVEHWDLFEDKLKALKKDETLEEFLEENFIEAKYEGLRKSAIRYVSGFDTADPAKASAFALRDEWLAEGHEDQYRLDNGYQQMISYLAEKSKEHGCNIHKGTIAKQIGWEKDKVSIATDNGNVYTGNKVIITVPIGVLQTADHEKGAISFIPAIPKIKNAIHDMAIGAIIKVLLQFSKPFWEGEKVTRHTGESMEDWGFLLSEETIPTFWTQYPVKNSLLTGWLGGPKAVALKDASDAHILGLTIQSLANIFSMQPADIMQLLVTSIVVNWTVDPFSLGSYSYATTTTNAARKILNSNVADTIYFAGEALYDGPEMGTVEAALASGKKVAENILSLVQHI